MKDLFRNRLDQVVSGRLPAGSSDARTLGLVLLHDVLGELQAIRALLERTTTDSGTTAPSPALPVDVLTASAQVVKQAVQHADRLELVEQYKAEEMKRAKPRKSVLAAIERHIATLSEVRETPI